MKPILLHFLYLTVCPLILSAQNTINGIVPGEIHPAGPTKLTSTCDTIFSFSTIDPFPVGLAFDGTHLYTAGQSQSIYKFDLTGQLTGTIPYPGFAGVGGDMDFDGSFLWVVVEQEGRIFKLDPSNGDILTSFTLPDNHTGDPNFYGCAYDNGYIWTTDYIDETLLRINATTGEIVDSFVIHRSILPLKIIKGDLYGIDDSKLVKLDKSTGEVIDSQPWCLEYSLGLSWADGHLWGLSSSIFIGGTQRIYQFENLISSTDPLAGITHMRISPNPATQAITISSSDELNSIEIYSMMGSIVFAMPGVAASAPFDIDLSDFQPGMYCIRFSEGRNYQVEKFLVQK